MNFLIKINCFNKLGSFIECLNVSGNKRINVCQFLEILIDFRSKDYLEQEYR